MIDFDNTLIANSAMTKSIASILADSSLSAPDRDSLITKNVTDYAEHTGMSLADACVAVAKIAKRQGARIEIAPPAPADIRKTEREIVITTRQPEPVQISKAAPREERRDPSATDEFLAKVAAIQGDNPRLSYQQAYARAYTDRANAPIVKRMKAEAPGREVRKQLPEPQMTSAQIAMAAKAIERERADPALSPEQAYSRAYTDPANRDIVKRMKGEQRAQS